jgi:hypothetical protein
MLLFQSAIHRDKHIDAAACALQQIAILDAAQPWPWTVDTSWPVN